MTEHADITGKEIALLAESEFTVPTVETVRQHVATAHGLTRGSIVAIVEDFRHLKAIVEAKVNLFELRK